jgi:p24 family protein alpha
MRSLAPFFTLLFVLTTHALHFYLDANEKRCFIEELPTDTIVEGHYKALEFSDEQKAYLVNPELGIHVEVDVRIIFF